MIETSKFHPACLLFPPLPEDELLALAEDISQNGLLHPIVTFDGQILDGRNRLAACKLAGIEPRFQEWTGGGSPLDWVVATNLMRRHLTPSQRAVVAFELLPMLQSEAKDRQRLSSGRGKKGAKELATISGKASQIAAKITKTNSAYVEKIKAISRQAPELISVIKSGRATVLEAVRLAKIDHRRRGHILRRANKRADEPITSIMRSVLIEHKQSPSQIASEKSKIEIWCGDCLDLMQHKIGDETVSVVTTSPPFNLGVKYANYKDNLSETDYLEWLSKVFSEIYRVLKSDGSFFLNIAHSPKHPWIAMKVAEVAGRYFSLQNQIIWIKTITVDAHSHGHFSPIQGRRFLNRNWEFIFHFVKEETTVLDRLAVGVPYQFEVNSGRTGLSTRCAGDTWFIPHQTVRGKEKRANHPATFPPELVQRCLKLAGIKKDMLVLDPFCGVNGMLGAANLGVRGIGIDLDPGYCQAARDRLEQNSR